MDLDDELRRMFANSGDQLDIPVRGDAEQTIVAGAGRRRKRRLAAMGASGAAAMAVVVAAGIALANPTPEAMPPAIPTSTTDAPSETTSTTTTPTSETVPVPPPAAPPTSGEVDPPNEETTEEEEPPPPAAQGEVIGPFGWRELRLGMTYDEAVATGLVVETGSPPGDGCTSYTIATADGSHGGALTFSYNGLEFIAPYAKVRTPEGVWEGMPIEQFLELYPEKADEVAQSGSVTIPAVGNSAAEYRIDHHGTGTVSMIALRIYARGCP